MLHAAELIRLVLIPFLLVDGTMLGGLLILLVAQRAVRELVRRRRLAIAARYRPTIDAITQFGLTPPALERLRRAPARHRPIIAGLLLAPLHVARGEVVSHVRVAAVGIGLVEQWLADLQDRRWWRRADGVRTLGFIDERSALPAVMHAFDDAHEEVRAAAVEAAGRLGDACAIPALIGHLTQPSRYQRSRVIDALRNLGPLVTPALVELARAQPDHARLAVEILGLIGTAAAIDPLLEWCADPRGDVRMAALASVGSIGLDDRSYYFTLRALGDSDPEVRAMAARALGRGRREEAVTYLAARLDDEWFSAAQAAGALRRLGAAGLRALQARGRDDGQAGDLARQMLWSPQPVTSHA